MNLFKFKPDNKKEQLEHTIVDADDGGTSVITLIKELIAGDVFLRDVVQKQFLFVLFLVENNELVGLWPFPDLKIAVSVVYFVLFCLGYLVGRIASWSSYAPLRSMLKQQIGRAHV